MSQTRDERRNQPRVSTGIYCSVRGGSTPKLTARIRNISRGGVCLQGDLPLSPGDAVELSMTDDSGRRFEAEAVIVWTSSREPAAVGAEFLAIRHDELLEPLLGSASEALGARVRSVLTALDPPGD